MEELATNFEQCLLYGENQNLEEENQDVSTESQNVENNDPDSQENNQEVSTSDGHSKNSLPNTPTMTIQDFCYNEVAREHLEAYSKIFNPINNASGSVQLPVHDAFWEESVVNIKEQQTHS